MGKLLEIIDPGGLHIATNVIILRRGRNITLIEDEQLIFQAILRD
jgi:hypothetical protein